MGGEARMPNIDKLRRKGMLFTNIYNNAKCAPSRAALMTGFYNQRIGAHRSAGNIGQGGSVCIAELMKAAGYATILSGKWHIKPDPLECGFERHYGSLMSPFYFAPIYVAGRKNIQEDGRKIEVDDSWYSTVAYTDFAIRTIKEEAAAKSKPFFLFLAYHAPHCPLQALKEDIARYKGRYADGTDALRKARYERLVELGIVDQKVWKLPQLEPGVPHWEQLTNE
jgi:arylsulfatase